MARLWLQVIEHHDGPGYGHPSELWWRDVTLEGTPSVGDRMMFLGSEDEPDGSVDIEVRNRYWALDGTLNIELRRIVHLPNDKWEEDGHHRWQGDYEGFIRNCPMPWRESDDAYGLLDDRLAWSDWQRFAALRRAK